MPIIAHAVISAAGFGSRLGKNVPKCLVEVGGRALIDYQLELLKDVPDVRIVVGFMEESVIQHVKRIRPDVVFVRNALFHSTSNSYSVHLATRELSEPYLIIDGDLLIEPCGFNSFLKDCMADGQSRIGVTASKTEEAVFAELDEQGRIVSFSFKNKTPWEWCGIAYINGAKIEPNQRFVFEELQKLLPARAAILDVHEIDTPRDLEEAQKHFSAYYSVPGAT